MHLPWERKDCRAAAKLHPACRGGAACHCHILPAEQTYGKAGPEAAHALQLQPSPESTWVELGATHRALPQEIPTGPDQRRRGRFHSVFPVLFIVQRQHCTLAPCNHHLHPELVFPGFPSVPSALLYILSNAGHLIFHGQFHSKK